MMSFVRKDISARAKFRWSLIVFLTVTVIEMINLFTGRFFNRFGLIPGHVESLPGLLISPLLHGSFFHYLSNIVPLTLMSYLLLYHGVIRYFLITIWVVLVGGLLLWCFGRVAIHVGSSGVIYGYFSYLCLAGILSRDFKLFLITVIVVFLYNGLIWGILPVSSFVSWEGHLLSAISGLMAAVFWGARPSVSN